MTFLMCHQKTPTNIFSLFVTKFMLDQTDEILTVKIKISNEKKGWEIFNVNILEKTITDDLFTSCKLPVLFIPFCFTTKKLDEKYVFDFSFSYFNDFILPPQFDSSFLNQMDEAIREWSEEGAVDRAFEIALEIMHKAKKHHNDLQYRHIALLPHFEEIIINRRKTIEISLRPVFLDFSDIVDLDKIYEQDFNSYLKYCLDQLE